MGMKITIVTSIQSGRSQSRGIYDVIIDSFSHFTDDLCILSGENFVTVAHQYGPEDILLFTNVNFNFMSRNQFEKILSQVCAYKVYVGFDDEYKLHETAYYSQFVDLLVTFDLVAFEYFRSIGRNVIICPHPVDVLDVTLRSEYRFDLSFIGQISSVDQSRYNYLTMLKDRYPNSFFPSLDGISLNESDVRDIYFNSKINLNFTAITDNSNHLKLPFSNYRRGFKGRPMEIGASRGFCLSEFSPSIQNFFVPKHDLDYFYDSNDLIEKIDYYIANDRARSLMQGNIFIKVSNYYSASSPLNLFANKIIEASRINRRRPGDTDYSGNCFSVDLDYERLLYIFKFRGVLEFISAWFLLLIQSKTSFIYVNINILKNIVARFFK